MRDDRRIGRRAWNKTGRDEFAPIERERDWIKTARCVAIPRAEAITRLWHSRQHHRFAVILGDSQISAGDLFVTRSRTPYEVRFESPAGQELDNLSLHIAVEPFLAAVEARYPGRANRIEVVDFFGRDEILWPICLTCAELLAARVPGKSPRVAALTRDVRPHPSGETDTIKIPTPKPQNKP